MKKHEKLELAWVIVVILAGVIVSSFASPPPANGKIEIIFRVPAKYAPNFRQAFLAYIPNSKMIDDPASTPEDPLPQIHLYTTRQHIRNEIQDHMAKCEERGNKILRSRIQQFIRDPNSIEME